MQKTCTTCGGEIPNEARFCKKCGVQQQAVDAALDHKRSRVLARERKWLKPAIAAGVAVFLVLAGWMITRTAGSKQMSAMQGVAPRGGDRPAAAAVSAENGVIKIPAPALDDRAAHYFAYTAGGKEIRFFLLRAPDGSVRAALDACTACYRAKLGYRPGSDTMICNNCGMSFRSTDVGIISGGCSPIPLQKTVDGSTIVLKAKDIEAGAQYF